MNRVIKFRYRYTDGKNWIIQCFTLDQIVNGEPFEVLSDNPMLRNYKHIGEDQFIGLTDKNGKEIYEGDVLLWNQNYLFKVEYEVCQFIGQAWDGNNTAGYLSFHHFTNSEIIGNIYEHPHLLNS